MQIKTKFNKILKKNSDKFYNCINIDNDLIQNIHNIYKKKCEMDRETLNLSYLNELCDINSSNLNKMCDINDICVSLKLKLKIKNNNELDNKNYSIYFDINPGGIMSKNQKKIYYQYKHTTEKNDEYFENFPREEKMKYFSSLSYKLAGKIIQYKQSKYKLVNLLQSAIYGSVYLSEVIEDSDKNLVNCQKAIKILSKHLIEMTKDKVQEDPLSEYYYRDTMSGHSNILSCDHIFDDNSYIYMVMPFALHGDLFEVMKNRNRAFSEEEGRYLFYQILLAIKFLHSKKMALRDISLENVLLFENEKNGLIYPVLNDPGQAIYFNVNNKNEVILEEYKKIFGKIFRPPEIYEKCKYDPTKVDIFCAGYILYFCLTKHELFRCALNKDIYWNLLKNKKYEELLKDKKGLHLSEEVLDLIFHCLEPNFKKRYNINEALNHSWFKGKFFPIYNFNLYLNDDMSYKYNSSDLFKLSLEIQEYAKKNNMKIDENSTIQFFIYEHIFISPNKNMEKQNKYINSLKYSHINNKRENGEDNNSESILTSNNNNNRSNKTTVISINNNRCSMITTNKSEDTLYINNHINNDFITNNSDNNNDDYVVHINNNDIHYKKLYKNNMDLNQTSKIKILNNHKKNIYKLIELKKKKKKLFSSSKSINFSNKNCSCNKESVRISQKSEENILTRKKRNIFITPRKNYENTTLSLLLENQLKRKNQLNKNVKSEKNIISLVKQHFKENINTTNNYDNTKYNDKYNTNKYTLLNELKETKKNPSKDTNQEIFLNKRNMVKKKNELFEENQKYNIIHNYKNTKKNNNFDNTSYRDEINNSETEDNTYIKSVSHAKNNDKNNILSNIQNEIIKYDPFELHKKKFVQMNDTSKNIVKENKLSKLLNDNIFNNQKKKDTKYFSFLLNGEKYIKNILSSKIISSPNDKNSKEETHNNIFDTNNIKEIETFNYENNNYLEKITKNDNLNISFKQNNREIYNEVLYEGKENELNEKKKSKINNLMLHNKNPIDNIILHNTLSEKVDNKKEENKISKNDDLNNYSLHYLETKNKFKHSMLINNKINSCKESIILEEKKKEKEDNKLFFQELKIKNKNMDLKNSDSLIDEKNSYIITKDDIDLLGEVETNSCTKKSSIEHILKNKFLDTSKNMIIESKKKSQVELKEKKLSKNSHSKLENSRYKSKDNLENEEIKSNDDLEYEEIKSKDNLENEEIKSNDDLEYEEIKSKDNLEYEEIKSKDNLEYEEIKSKDYLDFELENELEFEFENELENELENVIKNEENNLECESETDFNGELNNLINELNDKLIDEIENSYNQQETESKETLENKLKDEHKKILENELKKKPKDELQNDSLNVMKNGLGFSFKNSISDKYDKMLIHKEKLYIDKKKLNMINDDDFFFSKSRNKLCTMSNEKKRNLSSKIQIKAKSINKTKRGNYSFNSDRKNKIVTSDKFLFNTKKYIYNNNLKNDNYENISTKVIPKKNYSSLINLNKLESDNYNKRNENNVNEMPIIINEYKNKKSYQKIKLQTNEINKKNILGRHTISESPLICINKKNNNITNELESINRTNKIIDNIKGDKMSLIHNFRNTVGVSHLIKKGDISKIKDLKIPQNPSIHLIKENYNKKGFLKDNILKDNTKNRRSILNISNKTNLKNVNLKIKKNKSVINKILVEEKTSNCKEKLNLENNKNISNKKNIEQICKKNFNVDINLKSIKKRKRIIEIQQAKISNELLDFPLEEIKESNFEKLKSSKNRYSVNGDNKLTREDLDKNNNENIKNKITINLNDNTNKMNDGKNVNVNEFNDISSYDCDIIMNNKNKNETFHEKKILNFESRNNINEMNNIKENNLKYSDKWDFSKYTKKGIQSNKANYKTSKVLLKPIKNRQTIVYPNITPNNATKKDPLLIKRNSNVHYESTHKIKNIKKVIDEKTKNDNKLNLSNKSILENFLNEMNEIFEKKNKEKKLNPINDNKDIKNKKENNKIIEIQKIIEISHLRKTDTSMNIKNSSNKKGKINRTTQMLNQIYLKKNENNKSKSSLLKNGIKNKEDKIKKNISLGETSNLLQTKIENKKSNLELFDKNFNDLKKRKTYTTYFKKDIKNRINNTEKRINSDYNKTKEEIINENEKKNNNFNKKKEENASSNFEEKNFFLKNTVEIDKDAINEKNNLENFSDFLNETTSKKENFLNHFNNSINGHSGDHIERNEINKNDNNNNNIYYKNNENNIVNNNKNYEICSIKNDEVNKNDKENNTQNNEINKNKKNSISNIISNGNYNFYANKKNLQGDYKVYNDSDDLKVKNKSKHIKLLSQSKVEINNSLYEYLSVKEKNKIIKGRNTFNISSTELNKNNMSTYFKNDKINFNYVNTNNSSENPYYNHLKELKSFNNNLKKNLYLNKLKVSNQNKLSKLKSFLNYNKIENNKIFLNNMQTNFMKNNNENDKLLVKPNLFLLNDKTNYNKLGNIINKISDTGKLQHKIKTREYSENLTPLNISNLKNYNTNDIYENKDNKNNSINNYLIKIEEKKNHNNNNNNGRINNNIYNRNSELYLRNGINLNVENFIFNKNRKTSKSVKIDKSYFNLINKNVSCVKDINNKHIHQYLKNKLQNNDTSNEQFQINNKTNSISKNNEIILEKNSKDIHSNNIYLKSNTNNAKVKPLLYKSLKKEDLPYSQSTINKVNSCMNFKETKNDIVSENQKQTNIQHIFNEENKKYNNYINNTINLNPTRLSLNLNKIPYMNNQVESSKNNFFTGFQEKKNIKISQNRKKQIVVDLNNKINVCENVKRNINEDENKEVHIKNKYNEMINIKKNEIKTENINTYNNDLLYKNKPLYIDKKNEDLLSKSVRLINNLQIKKENKKNDNIYYHSQNKNDINKIDINKKYNNKNNEDNIESKSNLLQNGNDRKNNTIVNIKQPFYLNKILNIKEYMRNSVLYHTSNKNSCINQKENCQKISNKNNNFVNLLNNHILSSKLSSILFSKNNDNINKTT
ncbi:protein kinase, putative [Plasmodium gallinaceum]|uniref:Protein kinase, putative n=1 Tax=Plasmodium gallinaceum TaxID=5849 RepID=A0A1J1GSE1_PLAGA|nr:protein kinase, putative [Plasmodium gallinaceum]CRG95340.1 protein kinase, putative [Plasmodium gallinaceum]